MADEFLVAACGISFPDQGSNPGPLLWECRVLATGPPEWSLHPHFICEKTEAHRAQARSWEANWGGKIFQPAKETGHAHDCILITASGGRYSYYLHSTDEETEAPRKPLRYPRLHSWPSPEHIALITNLSENPATWNLNIGTTSGNNHITQCNPAPQ